MAMTFEFQKLWSPATKWQSKVMLAIKCLQVVATTFKVVATSSKNHSHEFKSCGHELYTSRKYKVVSMSLVRMFIHTIYKCCMVWISMLEFKIKNVALINLESCVSLVICSPCCLTPKHRKYPQMLSAGRNIESSTSRVTTWYGPNKVWLGAWHHGILLPRTHYFPHLQTYCNSSTTVLTTGCIMWCLYEGGDVQTNPLTWNQLDDQESKNKTTEVPHEVPMPQSSTIIYKHMQK